VSRRVAHAKWAKNSFAFVYFHLTQNHKILDEKPFDSLHLVAYIPARSTAEEKQKLHGSLLF
jgi:hypothetical protein